MHFVDLVGGGCLDLLDSWPQGPGLLRRCRPTSCTRQCAGPSVGTGTPDFMLGCPEHRTPTSTKKLLLGGLVRSASGRAFVADGDVHADYGTISAAKHRSEIWLETRLHVLTIHAHEDPPTARGVDAKNLHASPCLSFYMEVRAVLAAPRSRLWCRRAMIPYFVLGISSEQDGMPSALKATEMTGSWSALKW